MEVLMVHNIFFERKIKMKRAEILDRLVPVFQSVFNREIKLEESTTASDVEGWDSLRHITLMTAIGTEFGIQFQMKDIVHLEDVGDIVSLIDDEM